MEFLLTSAGVTNTSIHDALVDLLGKPIAECDALCIPTASYGHPMAGPGRAWAFISGREPRTPMCELGWKSLGVLGADRAAQHRGGTLGAMGPRGRRPAGEWRRRPVSVSLDAAVRAGRPLAVAARDGLGGLSAGSMVMTPRIGEDFVQWKPPTAGDETLGVVDFSIFPHVENPDLPTNTLAAAERWAADIAGQAYAIDDQTAIKVVNGTVEVVSEGQWKLFTPSPQRAKDVIPICLTAVSSGDDDAAAAVEVVRGRLQEERGHARA